MVDLSHDECLDKLLALCDYAGLKQQIASWRDAGRVVGFGLASFVEFTATGSEGYGRAGVPVSSLDTVVVSMDPSGTVTAQSSAAEIGQGIQQGLAQILADALGLPINRIRVKLGDTQSAPHGGGAWSSRGAAITGEVAWRAGRKLRLELLSAAGTLFQIEADRLDILDGEIVEKETGRVRMQSFRTCRGDPFRPYEFPQDLHPQLTVLRHGRA